MPALAAVERPEVSLLGEMLKGVPVPVEVGLVVILKPGMRFAASVLMSAEELVLVLAGAPVVLLGMGWLWLEEESVLVVLTGAGVSRGCWLSRR